MLHSKCLRIFDCLISVTILKTIVTMTQRLWQQYNENYNFIGFVVSASTLKWKIIKHLNMLYRKILFGPVGDKTNLGCVHVYCGENVTNK